jgi:hypothetical protein
MSTSLKTLITKLNASARMATQRAANLCLANGHYEVDLEHLFLALLEQTDNDLARVLRANRISATAIQSDLEREIQTFKNGNTRTPVFSQHLQQARQDARARPVHHQPHAARARRQGRPGDRPRHRDPPGHRHPDAPAPEQPDPDRRSRRRQDRGGRGAGAAHRGGDVPESLRGVEIHTLDMGLLQAGASVKGEFENRLKNVIDRSEEEPAPDHPVHRRGPHHDRRRRPGRQNDAANLLKPALARGELRTIAATTWGEYKKYFEKDAALARRFQVVKVEEPERGTGLRHAARHGAADGEALRRARARRSHHRGGAPVAPLHQRPPAAGQGDQRARHRLREGGARPERDAGADRGSEPRPRTHRGRERRAGARQSGRRRHEARRPNCAANVRCRPS